MHRWLPARHRWSVATGVALLTSLQPSTGLGQAAAGAGAAGIPATWPLAGQARPVVGGSAMVVSISPIATDVGLDVLRQGGNAVDAAVAVGFALAVVHPSAGNLGGGGFMVIRTADGATRTLDYRETAPAGATSDMYLDPEGNVTDRGVIGHLAAGVPGSVAGLAEAAARYGHLPLPQLVQPAIRLARLGFVVDEYRSRSIALARGRLERFPSSARQFLPGGAPPANGDTLRQPDLARTLEAISHAGAAGFYSGAVAALIAAEMERGGGLITKRDLAAYRPIWREPINIDYRGHTIYSMPPASSGGVTLGEILNTLEGYTPLQPFGTPIHAHVTAEAMRRAFFDRNRFLGDPAFVEMPLERLLSKDYAAELRATIDTLRATPTRALPSADRGGNQTTHYSIVDPAGNAVSVTTTLNSSYGSALTVSGAGFLLNNEMDDFTTAPGKPNLYGLIQGEANTIEPGKRMLSAMTPTIVLDRDGSLMMVVGTPGGPTIITTVAQVISNVIDHGMSLPNAVSAPRIHHQSLPDQIYFENGGLAPEAVAALEALGHKVLERGGYSGQVAAILRGPEGWVGVADPRGAGSAGGF